MALIQVMPSRILIDIPALADLAKFLREYIQVENQQEQIDALTETVNQLTQKLQQSETVLEGTIKENK